VASCLILLGSGLLSTISGGNSIDKAVYGYEFILGLGCGLILSSMTMMVNLVTTLEDNGTNSMILPSKTRNSPNSRL
jgi:hypothetical protein